MVETAEGPGWRSWSRWAAPHKFADRIHGLITFSPLFENFNLAEIRALSRFMQAYGTEPGVEIIREGEAGDFMGFLIEGRIEVFKQDRWNAPRLIALSRRGSRSAKCR